MIHEDIIASVCIITYNQKDFIAQTIEGALKQKANFSYEIVISDDCSTDGTLDVCHAYQKLYPETITVLENKVNLGMNKNWMKAIEHCKGEYIALCEGDDYWCDENKIQKQIDFLQTHSEYSICFHRVHELVGNILYREKLNTATEEKTYTIEDLAKGNFIHTPSVVFRNRLFKKFPDWFEVSPVCDYVVHMLNARCGLIKYFPEPMAVYRKHNGSVWSHLERTSIIEKWLTVLDYLLTEEFCANVKERLFLQKRNDMEEYLLFLMYQHNWQLFLEKLSIFSKEDKYITEKWLLKYFPQYIKSITRSRSYRLAKSVKGFITKMKR